MKLLQPQFSQEALDQLAVFSAMIAQLDAQCGPADAGDRMKVEMMRDELINSCFELSKNLCPIGFLVDVFDLSEIVVAQAGGGN